MRDKQRNTDADQVEPRESEASKVKKHYFAIAQSRSISDNGLYVPFVAKAASDPTVFETFRAHPIYREILEHVTESDGRNYLDQILNDNRSFFDKIDELKLNDDVGQPFTCSYEGVGLISPTTLRYIKVASDLKVYFGPNIGSKLVEIGVGYGGQMLAIDRLFRVKEYHLYDLLPVLSLVSRYLESYTLNGSYKLMTLNQTFGDESYDLAISNYGFSELPSMLQRSYIKKILSKAKKGYLTMNSGLVGSVFTEDKLSLEELRGLLPAFDVREEIPLTGPENYIIVWGHK